MEYLELNGKKYEIDHYDDAGVPVIKARVEETEEVNPDGTIKRSVHVFVPSANIFQKPGING